MAPKRKQKAEPIDPAPLLAAAERALAEDDAGAALDALLDAWRATPAPPIAEIVEAVSARLAHGRPPIEGKTLKARHEAWLIVAAKRDAADVPRLHDVIPAMQSAQAVAQMETLLEGPSDPRHTTFFLAMIQKPPYVGSSTAKVWRRVFGLLENGADPRLVERLAQLDFLAIFPRGLREGDATREIMQARTASILRMLAKRWPDGPPKLDGRAAEIATRLAGAVKDQRASADDLHAQVLANPDDDGPRQVLGDALLEAGDPRGELIALQFQRARRALTTVEARRERELVAAHWRTWLGSLATVVKEEGLVFEKGFPSEVVVDLRTPNQRKVAVGHPLWATVRLVDLGYGEHLPDEIFTHPVMTSLRGVVNLQRPAFRTIARRVQPLPWTVFGYYGPDLWRAHQNYANAAELEANREDCELITRQLHRVLPKLTELSLSGYLVGPADYGWLWGAPIAKQLETFHVSSGISSVPAWIEDLRARELPRLRCLRVGFHFRGFEWQIDVRHGPGGPFSMMHARLGPRYSTRAAPKFSDLVSMVGDLRAEQLTHLTVSASRIVKSDAAALRAVAERQMRLAELVLP